MKTWLKALIGVVVVLVALIAIGATQIEEGERAEEFKLQNFVFTSKKAEGYMNYTEQPDATYDVGDNVWMYTNIKNIEHEPAPGKNVKIWFTVDIKVVRENKTVATITDSTGRYAIPEDWLETFFTWTQLDTSYSAEEATWLFDNFSAGEYTVTLTITDELGDATDTVSGNFTLE